MLTFVMKVLVYSLVICCLTQKLYATNILIMSAMMSPSHHIFNKVLAKSLSEKGHNVTMMGNDFEKYKSKTFHYIQMEGVYEHFDNELNLTDWFDLSPLKTLKWMYDFGVEYSQETAKSKGFQQIMSYPKDYTFDLIIYDLSFAQFLYGLADKFGNPPTVGITAFLLPPNLVEPFGGHFYPSYNPHFTVQYSENMNFWQRLHNFLLTSADILYRKYIYTKQQYKLMQKLFGENVKSIEEYEKEIAILLTNTDPILDYPLSLPPNIIPIGGMHIREPKSLPENLEAIASRGDFIFFSLGTNIKSSKLNENTKGELLAAFAQLSVNVLWKYEAQIENLPPNVFIEKWLPQNDILAHKNCKLFITHAGGLSTQEAQYHGVPVIGIPGFLDQHKNIKKLVEKDLGLQLSFSNIQQKLVLETIEEVLKNKKYANNMQKVSAKFKDQPQKPLDRAIFWIEYVLRHKGAKELELPSRHMCFLTTTSLDVVAFLFSVVFTVLYVIFKIVKSTLSFNNTCKRKVKTKTH